MPSRSILFVNSSDEAFGSARVLLSVVEAAAGAGFGTRVLLPDDQGDGWLGSELARRGFDVRHGPLAPARRRYLGPRGLPGYLVRLAGERRFVRAHLEELSPALLYLNTSAVGLGAVAPPRPAAPVVWHVHELIVSPRPLAWLFRTLPMRWADDVVAISGAVAANLERSRGRAVVHRIPNGVARRGTPVREREAGGRALCAYVGRLSWWKGYEVFVEAMAEVARSAPTARFVVAGTPPPGEEWRMAALHARLAELGIAERTEVMGMCHDVPALLDEAHVVVVPSRWPEPFGLVTAEAMSSGCAVVATDHGGTREIVEDGVSGVLVEPGAAPALTRAVLGLLEDEPRRRRLAAAGQARAAEEFSEDRFRRSVLEVIEARAGGTIS